MAIVVAGVGAVKGWLIKTITTTSAQCDQGLDVVGGAVVKGLAEEAVDAAAAPLACSQGLSIEGCRCSSSNGTVESSGSSSSWSGCSRGLGDDDHNDFSTIRYGTRCSWSGGGAGRGRGGFRRSHTYRAVESGGSSCSGIVRCRELGVLGNQGQGMDVLRGWGEGRDGIV